jgi:Cu2+-exporting ATPase
MTADVGICMPKGADLAREAAQVLLLSDDRTPARGQGGGHAHQRHRQALLLFHHRINSLILFLAGSGLSPLASALLHNVSTVGILGYAALAAGRPVDGDKTASPGARSNQEVAA